MVALNHWCAVILNCTLAADPGSSIIILFVNEHSHTVQYCIHVTYIYHIVTCSINKIMSEFIKWL